MGYNGKAMGYDEAILTIAQKHGVSWLPWAWLPRAANGDGPKCEDINGGDSAGTKLANATDGKGPDWVTLWPQFAGGGAPAPSPSGCPGGSLSACMALCPSS